MAKFQLKRGPLSELPSTLDEGDHYLAIDQTPPQLYVGPQGGESPEILSGGVEERLISSNAVTVGVGEVFLPEKAFKNTLNINISNGEFVTDGADGRFRFPSPTNSLTNAQIASMVVGTDTAGYNVIPKPDGSGELSFQAYDENGFLDLSNNSVTFNYYIEIYA